MSGTHLEGRELYPSPVIREDDLSVYQLSTGGHLVTARVSFAERQRRGIEVLAALSLAQLLARFDDDTDVLTVPDDLLAA